MLPPPRHCPVLRPVMIVHWSPFARFAVTKPATRSSLRPCASLECPRDIRPGWSPRCKFRRDCGVRKAFDQKSARCPILVTIGRSDTSGLKGARLSRSFGAAFCLYCPIEFTRSVPLHMAFSVQAIGKSGDGAEVSSRQKNGRVNTRPESRQRG